MKEIAVYIDCDYRKSGVYQYCKSVLHALRSMKEGYAHVTVVYNQESWKPFLDKHEFDQIHIPHSPRLQKFYQAGMALGGYWFFRTFGPSFDPCIRFVNSSRYDLVIFPSQEVLAALVKAPMMVTIHDLMHKYERRFPESGSYLRFRFREKYFGSVSKNALGILVDSDVGKKQVIESYSALPSKIKVMPYIAPDYVFDHEVSREQVDALLERKKLPRRYIFYPAQLWLHKNHHRLVKAIGLLKKKFPDIALVLTGAPKNNYNNVLGVIREYNLEQNVHLAGYVSEEELLCLYKGAVALVMPTYYGPTNIPPLEAFAVGCPVAVSRIYAMPEQAGDAALYFNPDSPEEIAEVISRYWTDESLRQTMIKRGKVKTESWSQPGFNRVFEKNLIEVLGQ